MISVLIDCCAAHAQQSEVAALRAQLASHKEKNREKDKIINQLASKMKRTRADNKQEALRL